MAYFNHAFQKMLIANNDVPILNIGVTTDLLPGQIGAYAYDDPTGTLVNLSVAPIAITDCETIVLAQGSFYANDKLGEFHGGYQETVKTKGINPKYVTEFYKIEPSNAQSQILQITPSGTANACFMCDETYYLYIKVIGSPILRTMGHTKGILVPAYTGCCDDPSAPPVTVTDDTVLDLWATYINEDPILSIFIQAVGPTESGNTGILVLNAAYIDTVFGNCSFEKRDAYSVEPLKIIVDQRLEDGESCNNACVVVNETQEALQGKGYGETFMRDYILAKEYRQEAHTDNPRLREVVGQTTITDFDRTLKYNRYGILHTVPRFNNSSGLFDNDQYLITIISMEGVALTDLETYLEAAMHISGNNTDFKTIL